MITQFKGNAVVRQLIRSSTPEQTNAVAKLLMVGWQLEESKKRQCHYCHTAMAGPVLHSPKGGVYHIGCALAHHYVPALIAEIERLQTGSSAGKEQSNA